MHHTGGVGSNGGTINIYGNAIVTATGSLGSAGIGGGSGSSNTYNSHGGDGGIINIRGNATVTATGGGTRTSGKAGGAGIGGGGGGVGTYFNNARGSGGNGGAINIYGNATVTATGGAGSLDHSRGAGGGAGIGGGGGGGNGTTGAADVGVRGAGGAGGTINIHGNASVRATGGHSVVAQGGLSGAGIGSGGGTGNRGLGGRTDIITISDTASVTATGGAGNWGAGIGGGNGTTANAVARLSINGGTVTAQGAPGIGGFRRFAQNSPLEITITGGTITATNTSGNGAGIGGRNNDEAGAINISGGTITATGTGSGAGIGGSGTGQGGNIVITGGSINATRGATNNNTALRPHGIGSGGTAIAANVGTLTNGVANGNFTLFPLERTIAPNTPVTSWAQHPQLAALAALAPYYDFNDVRSGADGRVFLWLPPVTHEVSFEVVGPAGQAGTNLTATSSTNTPPAITSGSLVREGSRVVFTANPPANNVLRQWTLNGTPVDGTTATLEIPSLTAPAHVTVLFGQQTHVAFGVDPAGSGSGTISATAGGVAIPPSSSQWSGTDLTFTASPAPGSRIRQWRNGPDVIPNNTSNTLNINNITAPVSILAEFERYHTLSFSYGPGGQITSANVGNQEIASGQTLAHGQTANFTATPNYGFQVSRWLLNNAPQAGQGTTYTTPPITANTTVRAEFEMIPHTVRFEIGGGNPPIIESVNHGQTVPRPSPDPSWDMSVAHPDFVEGGTIDFVGWFTAPQSGGTEFDFQTPITAPIVIYAEWSPQAPTYDVVFHNTGETTIPNQNIIHGGTVTRPTPPPNKTGYSFLGWFTEPEGSPTAVGFDFDAALMSGPVVDIYGHWELLEFEVSFDPDGGMMVRPQIQTVTIHTNNGRAVEPQEPTLSDVAFYGWFETTGPGSISPNAWDFNTLITQDTDLIAQWRSIFNVEFSVAGGNGSITATAGNVAIPASPGTAVEGQSVVFTAQPNPGFRVREWRHGDGTVIAGITSNTYGIPAISGDVSVVVEFEQTPVSDIVNVPTTATINTPLSINAIAIPQDALNRTIVWSLLEDGGTNAVLSGNTITAEYEGIVILRATITNGIAPGVDFVKDFNITVTEEPPATHTVTVIGSHALESGAGYHTAGDTVTIFAGSRYGYSFTGWTAVGIPLASLANQFEATTTFTMPDNDVTLTANWQSSPGGGAGGGDSDNLRPRPPATAPEATPPGPGLPPGSGAPTPGSGAGDTSGANEPPFGDVNPDDWFFEAVMYLFGREIMAGTAPGRFDPHVNITRGMVAQVLYNLEGRPDVTGMPNQFNDVLPGIWYTDAVIWADAHNVMIGFGDDTFRPSDHITRAHLVLSLSRYADFAGIELPFLLAYTGFADSADVRSYAVEAIERFYESMLIIGRPQNIFDPQGYATRAEMALMLYRLMQL